MTTFALAASIESVLQREFAGNSVGRWLVGLGVLALTTAVLGVVKRLVVIRLAALAEKTETDLDDLLVELVRRTSGFCLVALGVFFAHHWINLSDTATDYIRIAVKVALWVQVGFWGRGLIDFGIVRMTRGRGTDDPARTMGAPVLVFVGQVLVWSVVGLMILQAAHQDITTLIAGLGVGGIAVALAAQNILGDLFASITILLDKPFVIGDSIVLGDFAGTVEHIGVKTTRVRSVTGEQIIIGNHDLVSSRVRNFKRLTERRQIFTIGVTYDTSEAQVAAIPGMLKEIVVAIPDTRFDRAHFKSFGDFALIFEVVYFVQKPDFNTLMDVQQKINLEIYRRFAADKIEFAFPTQVVHTVTPPLPPPPPPAAPQKELSRG
jgi:small-conductance mechanosensitive channel